MNQTTYNVCLGLVVVGLAAHHVYMVSVLNRFADHLHDYLYSSDTEYAKSYDNNGVRT